MKTLELQNELMQLEQRHIIENQRQLLGQVPSYQRPPMPNGRPINIRIRGNPVVYHVQYKDVTRVGKVVRNRHRNYAYQSDYDFVKRDWERCLASHAYNNAVHLNRSLVQGEILFHNLIHEADR